MPSTGNGQAPDRARSESTGETWLAVQTALDRGGRGFPGGSSLARLLANERGVRNPMDLVPFTTAEILKWADAHRDRHGKWPTSTSGPVPEAPGETWQAVVVALIQGGRGLPGGSSLARLLARERAARNHMDLAAFTIPQILDWADAHRDRHGTWPSVSSGPIPEAPGETWRRVHEALYRGLRGLPGGSSLARLLAERRAAQRPGPPSSGGRADPRLGRRPPRENGLLAEREVGADSRSARREVAKHRKRPPPWLTGIPWRFVTVPALGPETGHSATYPPQTIIRGRAQFG